MRLDPLYRLAFRHPEAFKTDRGRFRGANTARREGEGFVPVTHDTDDERYRWLDGTVCAVAGEVDGATDGYAGEARAASSRHRQALPCIVLDVAELVWEPLNYDVSDEL